ncbi:MAG: type II toxin-antitoxin system prevent-host-death family antitoxin [Pseudomonadota bacterium]
METSYTVREAKARLSELLDRVAAGESVEIMRQGAKKGVFRVVLSDSTYPKRTPGSLTGKITIPDDFDNEVDDITADFEAG